MLAVLVCGAPSLATAMAPAIYIAAMRASTDHVRSLCSLSLPNIITNPMRINMRATTPAIRWFGSDWLTRMPCL